MRSQLVARNGPIVFNIPMGVASRIVSVIRDGRVISAMHFHLNRSFNRIWKAVRGELRDYLRECHGVIHVGANEDQERKSYGRHGLRVVWIEPIPDVYERLVSNISFQVIGRSEAHHRQGGRQMRSARIQQRWRQSSSILDLHMHRDIWPEVSYIHEIAVASATLPSAFRKAGVNAEDYDALVLDTQGSELLVLCGAESSGG